MPLSSAGLKAAIKTQLEAQFGAPSDPTSEDKFADAVATAVINYLTANALVLPGSFTTSAGAVTGAGVLS